MGFKLIIRKIQQPLPILLGNMFTCIQYVTPYFIRITYSIKAFGNKLGNITKDDIHIRHPIHKNHWATVVYGIKTPKLWENRFYKPLFSRSKFFINQVRNFIPFPSREDIFKCHHSHLCPSSKGGAA